MKMCLVMILVMKVFIFSKTMIICLLCPLLCGLFFFWKGAKGELSYKEINSQCAMFYIRKSKSLTGGNTTQTLLDLPNGITLKNEVFAPCEIIDGSWTPYGNTGYINARNGQINVRCKDSTSTSIVIAMFTVPSYFIQFS